MHFFFSLFFSFGLAHFPLFLPFFFPARPSPAGLFLFFPTPPCGPAGLVQPAPSPLPYVSRCQAGPAYRAHLQPRARLGFEPETDRGATCHAALGAHTKGPGPRPYLRRCLAPLEPIKAAATAPRLAALAHAAAFAA
jgi:hypothetical protein